MSDRVAWLAENPADDDFLFASGRFRGYIALGPGVGEELHDASVDEALAWARGRAPAVLIRLWDSDYFSAGERNPDPARYEEWPPSDLDVRPRRPHGLQALDNTESDPPVLWDVRLTPDPAVDHTEFRLSVERDPRALQVPLRAVEPHPEIRVLVRASTQAQAGSIAEELTDTAHEAADPGSRLRSRDRANRGWVRSGPRVYPYAPDARVRFGAATRPVPRPEDD
jgi:hypothetical protein